MRFAAHRRMLAGILALIVVAVGLPFVGVPIRSMYLRNAPHAGHG